MSIAATLTALGAVMEAAEILDTDLLPGDPSMARTPSRVLVNPAESISLGDFPAGVLMLQAGADHLWKVEAVGLGRHNYAIQLLWLVGARELTSIEELHIRATRWVEPLARAFFGGITLDNRVKFLGDGSSSLFTYQIGPFDWGEGRYFGLKVRVPVVEKINVTMEL